VVVLGAFDLARFAVFSGVVADALSKRRVEKSPIIIFPFLLASKDDTFVSRNHTIPLTDGPSEQGLRVNRMNQSINFRVFF
jgi:hypothetical protein